MTEPTAPLYLEAKGCDKVFEGMRAAHNHHVYLTRMVDQKANILLGASLVLVSAIQAWFANGLPINIAMILLMVTAALTSVFSLLTVIPRVVPSDNKTPIDNPFFFGSFSNLSFDQYMVEIDQQVSTNEDTRRHLAHSIFYMGKVLVRKHQSLRRSYLVLSAGVLSSGAAFIIEWAIRGYQ